MTRILNQTLEICLKNEEIKKIIIKVFFLIKNNNNTGETSMLKLFRIESNVGIYHTKNFQNKQELVSTKP